jgi:alpha-tubulin suppressor-like RCC1 family protein
LLVLRLSFHAAHLRWVQHPLPVSLPSGIKVAAIAAGAFHSGAVDEDGRAWMWGHGGSWQLGLGVNAHECIPQQVGVILHCLLYSLFLSGMGR